MNEAKAIEMIAQRQLDVDRLVADCDRMGAEQAVKRDLFLDALERFNNARTYDDLILGLDALRVKLQLLYLIYRVQRN